MKQLEPKRLGYGPPTIETTKFLEISKADRPNFCEVCKKYWPKAKFNRHVERCCKKKNKVKAPKNKPKECPDCKKTIQHGNLSQHRRANHKL